MVQKNGQRAKCSGILVEVSGVPGGLNRPKCLTAPRSDAGTDGERLHQVIRTTYGVRAPRFLQVAPPLAWRSMPFYFYRNITHAWRSSTPRVSRNLRVFVLSMIEILSVGSDRVGFPMSTGATRTLGLCVK